MEKFLYDFLNINGHIVGGYVVHLVTGCDFNDIDIFFNNPYDLYRGYQLKNKVDNFKLDLRLCNDYPMYDKFDISISQVEISSGNIKYSEHFEKSINSGIVNIIFDNIINPHKTMRRIQKYQERGFQFKPDELNSVRRLCI
jgi:hypothetical protein